MAKIGKWSGAAKRNIKRYNSYKKNLEKRVNKMLEEGLTPVSALPLSYRDFTDTYIRYKNSRIKQIEKEERKSMGNIVSKMISDQVYELSEEQAYSIFNYMKTLPKEEREALGFDYSNINKAIALIREGTFVKEELDLWDIIRSKRESLFKLPKEEIKSILDSMGIKSTGKLKGDVAKIITNEFFYPKEKK